MTEIDVLGLAKERARERDEAQEKLDALREGKPYPSCTGDCGENGMYCCDGLWARAVVLREVRKLLDISTQTGKAPTAEEWRAVDRLNRYIDFTETDA